MAFHDVRLPDEIEKGAKGGPGFNTTVNQLFSGHEKRNVNWQDTRGSWNIGYGIEYKDGGLDELKAFFYTRRGKAHSFRFKDWSDYEIGDMEEETPQEIGTGDAAETEFQIEKRYSSGGYTFHREITKPVNGTLRVFLSGVEQFSGWSANYATGIITFITAPGGSVSVSILCEFDVPVRFDTDKLDIDMEIYNAGSVPEIPIVEVRVE